MNMKNLIRAIAVLAVLCTNANAQPIPSGGLRYVTHDGTLTGSGTSLSPLSVTGVHNEITATTLVANADDWNPAGLSTAHTVRIDCGGYYIQGIAGGVAGRRLTLINASATTSCYLPDDTHGSTSTTAANRFEIKWTGPFDAWNYTLLPHNAVELEYDGTIQRWIPVGQLGEFGYVNSYVGVVSYLTAAQFQTGSLGWTFSTEQPSPTVGTVNDWTPTNYNATTFRVVPTGNLTITGKSIVGFVRKFECILNVNAGGYTITLPHESGLSTATNRFVTATGTDVVLRPDQMACFQYDGHSSRWRVESSTGGAISGAGTLNYVPLWTPDGFTLGNSDITSTGTLVTIGNVDTDSTKVNGSLALNATNVAGRELYLKPSDAGTSSTIYMETSDAKILDITAVAGSTHARLSATNGFNLFVNSGSTAFLDAGGFIVTAGACCTTGVNGIHMMFEANAGLISATQPGTANREMVVQGTPVKLNVGATTMFSANSGTATIGAAASNTIGINGITTIAGTAQSLIVYNGPVNLIGDSGVAYSHALYYSTDTAGRTFGWGSRGGLWTLSDETATAIRLTVSGAGSMYASADDSFFGWDAASNRLGITKKSGGVARASYGSANDYCIAQSSGATIDPSNTFTDRFCVRSGGGVDLGSTLTPIETAKYTTFTPTTDGWYRILDGNTHISGVIRISGGFDNRTTNIELQTTVNGWGATGSIQQVRHSSYNAGNISHVRISSNTGTGAVHVDVYVHSIVTPGPLTIYGYGTGMPAFVTPIVVGAVADISDVQVLTLGDGFRTTKDVVVGSMTGANVAPLEIYDDRVAGQATAALTDAGSRNGLLAINANGTGAGIGGGLVIGNSQSHNVGSVGFAAIKGLLADGGGNTAGYLAFALRTSSADSALTEKMRLHMDGGVTIGTASPGLAGTHLRVEGSIHALNGGESNGNGGFKIDGISTLYRSTADGNLYLTNPYSVGGAGGYHNIIKPSSTQGSTWLRGGNANDGIRVSEEGNSNHVHTSGVNGRYVGDYFGDTGEGYGLNLAGYVDGHAASTIWHNAYSTYQTSGGAMSQAPKWRTTHPSFGARGIVMSYGTGAGIGFYADSAATTVGSTFTPTMRMLLTNNGTIFNITENSGTAFASGSWYTGGWTVFGPNTGSATAAGVGIGYSTTSVEGQITAVSPSTFWVPLSLSAEQIRFRPAGSSPNVTITTATANIAAVSFENTTGNKIDLYRDSVSNAYGFGIASSTLQVYAPTGGFIDFGGGDADNFTESCTIDNTTKMLSCVGGFGGGVGTTPTVIDASFSGTVNDWAPTGHASAGIIRATGTSTPIINGITAPTTSANGRSLWITNAGTTAIRIAHEAAGSTAANRITNTGGYNSYLDLFGACSVHFTYLTSGAGTTAGTSPRWVQDIISCWHLPGFVVDQEADFKANVTFAASTIVASTPTTTHRLYGYTEIGSLHAYTEPSTPGSDQADFDCDTDSTSWTMNCRISPSVARVVLHGLQYGDFASHDGRIMYLTNASTTNSVMLRHESGTATAANRFTIPDRDYTALPDHELGPEQTIQLIYDTTNDRWRLVNAGPITSEVRFNNYQRGSEFFDDFMGWPFIYTLMDGGTVQMLPSQSWTGYGNLFIHSPYGVGGGARPGVLRMEVHTNAAVTIAPPITAFIGTRVVQGDTNAGIPYGFNWHAGSGHTQFALSFQILDDGFFISPPLDDVDSFSFAAGCIDGDPDLTNTTAAAVRPPNGVFCWAGNNSNWQGCACEADTCTCNSLGVSITESDWARCEIDVNAAGTSVRIQITDTGGAGNTTITTNIPNDQDHMCGLGATIDRVDNDGFGYALLDYAWAKYTFTTKR
jgi:hypothetical protein